MHQTGNVATEEAIMKDMAVATDISMVHVYQDNSHLTIKDSHEEINEEENSLSDVQSISEFDTDDKNDLFKEVQDENGIIWDDEILESRRFSPYGSEMRSHSDIESLLGDSCSIDEVPVRDSNSYKIDALIASDSEKESSIDLSIRTSSPDTPHTYPKYRKPNVCFDLSDPLPCHCENPPTFPRNNRYSVLSNENSFDSFKDTDEEINLDLKDSGDIDDLETSFKTKRRQKISNKVHETIQKLNKQHQEFLDKVNKKRRERVASFRSSISKRKAENSYANNTSSKQNYSFVHETSCRTILDDLPTPFLCPRFSESLTRSKSSPCLHKEPTLFDKSRKNYRNVLPTSWGTNSKISISQRNLFTRNLSRRLTASLSNLDNYRNTTKGLQQDVSPKLSALKDSTTQTWLLDRKLNEKDLHFVREISSRVDMNDNSHCDRSQEAATSQRIGNVLSYESVECVSGKCRKLKEMSEKKNPDHESLTVRNTSCSDVIYSRNTINEENDKDKTDLSVYSDKSLSRYETISMSNVEVPLRKEETLKFSNEKIRPQDSYFENTTHQKSTPELDEYNLDSKDIDKIKQDASFKISSHDVSPNLSKSEDVEQLSFYDRNETQDCSVYSSNEQSKIKIKGNGNDGNIKERISARDKEGDICEAEPFEIQGTEKFCQTTPNYNRNQNSDSVKLFTEDYSKIYGSEKNDLDTQNTNPSDKGKKKITFVTDLERNLTSLDKPELSRCDSSETSTTIDLPVQSERDDYSSQSSNFSAYFQKDRIQDDTSERDCVGLDVGMSRTNPSTPIHNESTFEADGDLSYCNSPNILMSVQLAEENVQRTNENEMSSEDKKSESCPLEFHKVEKNFGESIFCEIEETDDDDDLSALDSCSLSVASEATSQTTSRREERRKRRSALRKIFSFLDTESLLQVALVCKEWKRVSRNRQLWKNVVLEGQKCSSQFLINLSRWCTALEYLTLKDLCPRDKKDSESEDTYNSEIRASLEPGMERMLQVSESSLKYISIVNCGIILTDKSIWLLSCYSRLLRHVEYLSDCYPVGPDVMWALGSGCRDVTSLKVQPLYPCSDDKKFSNKCLHIISQFCCDLTVLSIGGSNIDINGLVLIAKSCQRLQVLELHYCQEISQDTIVAICRLGFKQLQSISLIHTKTTASTIRQLYGSCRHLKDIKVCTSIMDFHQEDSESTETEQWDVFTKEMKELTTVAGLGNILTLNLQYN